MVLVACSGGGTDSTADTTTTSTAAPTTTVRPSDGSLVLGVVAPNSGEAAELGAAVTNAVDLAVRQINTLGGVNGVPIVAVVRDEGDSTAAADRAVQELVGLGVDAIIGPTSSLTLLGTLGTAVDGGVLTCAPTATALALDAYPDAGLLLRTTPSDSLQASALARLVEESGNSTAAVVYLDDAYGRPLADSVRRELALEGTTVVAEVGFTQDQASIDEAAATITAASPGAVVVIADNSSGPAIIRVIDSATKGVKPTFFVNDPIRRPASTAGAFDADLAQRIFGASPDAYPDSDFTAQLSALHPDTPVLFAQNAYDCVMLLALAAATTRSDDPVAMSAAVAALTVSGTRCVDFETCTVAIDAGRNIDYDGPGGALSIGPNGDPISAVFDRFGFDEAGRDISLGRLVVDNG